MGCTPGLQSPAAPSDVMDPNAQLESVNPAMCAKAALGVLTVSEEAAAGVDQVAPAVVAAEAAAPGGPERARPMRGRRSALHTGAHCLRGHSQSKPVLWSASRHEVGPRLRIVRVRRVGRTTNGVVP